MCISIIAVSNTDEYKDQVQALLGSVDLSKPDTANKNVSAVNNQIIVPNPSNANITGTLIKSGSANPVYGYSASWGTGGMPKINIHFMRMLPIYFTRSHLAIQSLN